MEIIKVGIYLNDCCFAGALAKALARRARGMVFRLLSAAEEAEDCHMVLSTGEYEGTGAVRLVRRPESEHLDGEPFCVYRYKDSSNLVNDLLFIYFQMTGYVSAYRGSTRYRLLIFAACGGGCGTTSAALSVCRQLNRFYGARCLYLNFCPIDDSRKYLPQEEAGGFLKLLYYLKTGRDFPVSAFIARDDELDYLRTGVVNAHLDEIDSHTMETLLIRLREEGRYDFLIADVGGHLCRINKELLGQAELVFLFHSARIPFPGKYREKISREIEDRTDEGKLVCVENFSEDRWDGEQHSAELFISRDYRAVSAEAGGRLVVDLSGNYGNEIAAIAERIMKETGDETVT